jgi:hypothetical protein
VTKMAEDLATARPASERAYYYSYIFRSHRECREGCFT